MWRSEEGWAEKVAQENMPMFKWGSQEYAQVIRGIGIGAGAILEALKKEGLHGEEDSEFPYNHNIPITYNEEPAFTKTGWLVFILDEESNGNN